MSTDLENKPAPAICCTLSSAPVGQIIEDDRVLAVITHDSNVDEDQLPRVYQSGLRCLNQIKVKEVWHANQPVEFGVTDDCRWAKTDDFMFVGLALSEQGKLNLNELVEQGYDKILSFTKSQGYSELVRVWNYLTDINFGEDDSERYKQFCYGRYQAFVNAGYDIKDFPAASAVGHQSGDVLIYLIASRQGCVHFENPQQTSAYCYPREYGPQSPSFARATYQGDAFAGVVYLSGTASIIGYETQHKGDLEGQLTVVLNNLDRLTGSIAERLNWASPFHSDILKVYLRDPEQLESIEKRIRSHYGLKPEIVFLHADICRADLLVEIEGICRALR